ncbi:MAG TPA: ABC transporter permease subunit [Patescibacteria group bacterium]
MRNILTIARKEWQNYLTTPTGYIFAGLMILVVNWMFLSDLFLLGQADLKNYWSLVVFLFSIFIPAISMGLLADEKKNSTWEMLLSLPINENELVLGKLLGSMVYIFAVTLLSLPMVATILLMGKPDPGLIAGGYVGTLLLGFSYLSVGLFMSSLSSSAIVGFLGSSVFLIINNLFGQDTILSRVPDFLKVILTNLSLYYRSSKFSAGLIDLNDLIFFISWIAVFSILTVLVLKTRDK